jgi:coenzyme F420-reducing hydrogenase delta subunit
MDSIRWTDMVDSVYTLVRLVGLDPEKIDIDSISIMDHRLIVRYIENGSQKFVSLPYEL